MRWDARKDEVEHKVKQSRILGKIKWNARKSTVEHEVNTR